MNAQEIDNALTMLFMLFGGVLTAHGVTVSHDTIMQMATDLSVIVPAAISLGAIVRSIVGHWNMTKIPETGVVVKANGAQTTALAASTSSVPIKVVGALLLGFLLLPAPAKAASNACSPQTIFKSLTPANFLTAVQSCGSDDIKAVIDNANTAPIDYVALSCMTPLQPLVTAVNSGGLLMAFQAFRRAKSSGLLANCLAWVNTTLAPIQ